MKPEFTFCIIIEKVSFIKNKINTRSLHGAVRREIGLFIAITAPFPGILFLACAVSRSVSVAGVRNL